MLTASLFANAPVSLSCVAEQEKASLCLAVIVPHILDGGAKARNQILGTLNQLAAKYARRPFSYVWAEAGSQPALEEALLQGNTFYPAVAAVNMKKGRYAPMHGSFGVEPIGEFLSRLLSGKEPTVPLDLDQVAVADTEKWDGKDGKMPVEEKEL